MPRLTAVEKQAETRNRLVDAATITFQERGYHAASLDEISDAAGYSTGAIYSNFAGKETLFVACVRHSSDVQQRSWNEFIASVDELGASPIRFGNVLESVLPNPKWTKAMVEFRTAIISDASSQFLLEIQHQWRDVVAGLLRVYCEANDLDPAMPVEAMAESVAALVDGLRLHALIDTELDIATAFSTTVHLLMTGQPLGAIDHV